MPRLRFQYRLRTIMAAAALAAYGLALLQTSRGGPQVSSGARVAAKVLAWRDARPRPATRTTTDPLPVLGATAIVHFAAHRRRAAKGS